MKARFKNKSTKKNEKAEESVEDNSKLVKIEWKGTILILQKQAFHKENQNNDTFDS